MFFWCFLRFWTSKKNFKIFLVAQRSFLGLMRCVRLCLTRKRWKTKEKTQKNDRRKKKFLPKKFFFCCFRRFDIEKKFFNFFLLAWWSFLGFGRVPRF